MNWKKITGLIIVGVIAALIVYDIVVIRRSGVEASISDIILDASLKHPYIPFLFGFLMGHFFWSQGQ
jgi:hypothetical protein